MYTHTHTHSYTCIWNIWNQIGHCITHKESSWLHSSGTQSTLCGRALHVILYTCRINHILHNIIPFQTHVSALHESLCSQRYSFCQCVWILPILSVPPGGNGHQALHVPLQVQLQPGKPSPRASWAEPSYWIPRASTEHCVHTLKMCKGPKTNRHVVCQRYVGKLPLNLQCWTSCRVCQFPVVSLE